MPCDGPQRAARAPGAPGCWRWQAVGPVMLDITVASRVEGRGGLAPTLHSGTARIQQGGGGARIKDWSGARRGAREVPGLTVQGLRDQGAHTVQSQYLDDKWNGNHTHTPDRTPAPRTTAAPRQFPSLPAPRCNASGDHLPSRAPCAAEPGYGKGISNSQATCFIIGTRARRDGSSIPHARRAKASRHTRLYPPNTCDRRPGAQCGM